MKMRGADAVAQTLKARGVEVVFGMCGHGNLAMLDALIDSGIRFISVHHEQVAVHAADAYFRVTGHPGVVLTTLGPGALNTTTALGDAALDASAVLVISGDVPSRFSGLGPYQEIDMHASADQVAISRPLTKRSYRVADPAALPYVVGRAWHEAVTGSPGPVHVHVPLDFFTAQSDYAISTPGPLFRPSLSQAAAESVMERLNTAERPVIYAGGGVVSGDASGALCEFAEVTGIPVATSMVAQGAISESHPLSIGFSGVVGTRPANSAISNADVVLAIGTRFPEMDTSSWRPAQFLDTARCDLIHIDIDPIQLGRLYKTKIAAVSDAREALLQLTRVAKECRHTARPSYLSEIQDARTAWAQEMAVTQEDDSWPAQPPHVLKMLRAALPDDAILVSGVGVRHMVGQHFPVLRPRTMLVASGFSTMGWEMGATLGAAVGAHDVPVVGVIGDGAFNSTVTALSTAVAYGVPAVWVLLNNQGYQSIAVYQDRHYGRRIGTDFERVDGTPYDIDYVSLARAYGADGERVTNFNELQIALQRGMTHGGNYLIEVPTAHRGKALASGQWDVNAIAAGDTSLLPAPLG